MQKVWIFCSNYNLVYISAHLKMWRDQISQWWPKNDDLSRAIHFGLKWDSLEQTQKKRIWVDDFKSVNGICTEWLNNIFTQCDHAKNTRGNGSLLVLPKVRCEMWVRKKNFRFSRSVNLQKPTKWRQKWKVFCQF